MYGEMLTKETFLVLVCQKSTQGREVDAQWVAHLFGVTKGTALNHLAQLVKEGYLVKDVVPWRTNAEKFYYRPTKSTVEAYREGDYDDDYKQYLRQMWEA